MLWRPMNSLAALDDAQPIGALGRALPTSTDARVARSVAEVAKPAKTSTLCAVVASHIGARHQPRAAADARR